MYFYPFLFTPDKMPGDLGDMRFINYVLEHGYLWINQVDIHKSFWDMPFFYPHKNTLAYSDMLIGGMMIYTPIRFFVQSPQTALQIWFVIVSILNFLSCYIFMTKVFKFKPFEASAGAFLFAFGLPRHAQFDHAQLFLQFFMIFSITAFLSVKPDNSKLKNNFLFLTGSVMFVLQLYTSFYLGWFMIFGTVLFLFLLLGLYNQELKNRVFEFLKLYKKEFFLSAIFSFILLLPLINHYLSVGSKFGWTFTALVKPFSMFVSDSFLDKFLITNPDIVHHETKIGLGLLTTIFVILGLMKFRYKLHIFLFIGLVLYFFSNIYMNVLLYHYFPGAVAIRAAGRCIFLLLPLYAIGLANFLKDKPKIIAAVFTLLFVMEQIPFRTGFRWEKSQHENNLKKYIIPSGCSVIYYSGKRHYENDLDILWFASNNDVYTANGYSGYAPHYIEGSVPDGCIINKDFR